MDETDVSRRAARADLHVLPSGARARGAGRPHAARTRRPDDGGDRARLPRRAGDDEAAADAREAQDQGGRHPVQRPCRPSAARPAGRGARGRLPDLQRGLRRARRPRRRGDPARHRARRPDARRARGAGTARADAAERRAARGAFRPAASWCCSPDQDRSRWDESQIARGREQLDRALALGRARRVRASRPRSPRCTQTSRSDWPEIAALYARARPADRLARGRAEPRRRRRRGGRPRGGARDRRWARSRRLPVLPLDPRRSAAPARPCRRGPRGLRARARARQGRAGAALSPHAGSKRSAGTVPLRPRAVPSGSAVRRRGERDQLGS